ncbi:sensor histidine kinase [Yinghuangia seranimata]|uniref:sensor histidine kinase n=1 Tax=Yinghuangia seranimata TaxID=408067 RepID=UPI00248C69CB|nr:nitrate- and nitrite sensing domain-containing protein [Yinghuangia seranimata]MDI2129325.1 nitrate- and nitrite sensing domain-containing protein [Yinghuangia seranimata]
MKLLFSIKNWRIRTRITALLLLPVIVAALLGGLRIQSSVDKTREMDVVQKAGEVINQSTTLVAFLEEERDQSASVLAGDHGTVDANADIQNLYKGTTTQYERFRAAVAKMDLDSLPLIQATVKTIEAQMQNLTNVRRSAYNNNLPFVTVQEYQKIILALLSINQQAPEITRDPDLIQGARALGLLGEVKAYASAERAIGLAYGAKPDSPFADAPEGLRQLISGDDEAIRKFKSVAPDEVRKLYDAAAVQGKASAVTNLLVAAQKTMSGGKQGIGSAEGFTQDGFRDLSTAKVTALMKLETRMGDELLKTADQLRDDARREALVNTILVVAALLFTIILGVIVARSLVRSLNTLRRSALEIAEQRLPETVRRLSESEPGDVDLNVEPIAVLSRDEVGQVARAFDAVHAEAVRLAAEQALLRGNVNSMFVNLSRRSQSLIQRQLALISDLENREADPDQLANLFKLDHLATRMRRNGENLLVLAGEEPGRRWTRPVPLVDVLRAAASEVEQYERVELGALPTTDIAGRAVNDLVHLLAELLENSTTFSSPHTKVRVTGHILPDGRALIEIHDNGIGLTGDDLADANQRLARPPVVDVSISRRMGLFVVGRLSTRHGIRVQLRPGDGGGTTALVMLPIELIQGDRPGGNWDKGTGRPAVEKGWEPDALTSSQEIPALPASAAGPQRPGPDAGRHEPPRLLPQRGGAAGPQTGSHALGGLAAAADTTQNGGPQTGQQSAYEPASAFSEGPTTHDTPFPGTPFAPADTDNPFAPVAQQPTVQDARPASDTAQFASPFGPVDQTQQQPVQLPQQSAFERPQYGQQQPATGEFGRPTAYGRPEYESPYQQPGFDHEPAEHSGNDRGAGLPRRGGQDTGAFPAAEQPGQTGQFGQPGQPGQTGQQRAAAWSAPEFDGLAPVAPPQQVPAYEAPQRRLDPQENGVRGQGQPPAGDALPAVRQPGLPDRRPQAGEPRALFRDQAGAPGQQPQQVPQQQAPQQQAPQALPQSRPALPELPQAEPVDALDSTSALPMVVDDERSPIFETLESDWFHRRTGRGGRMRAAQVRSRGELEGDVDESDSAEPIRPQDNGQSFGQPAAQPLDRRTPAATNPPLPPRTSEQALPRRSHAGPAAQAEAPGTLPTRQASHAAPVEQQSAAPTHQAQPAPQPGRPAVEQPGSGWYSAGDEGWRAAEAAREPASSGTTGAGLPRRVPRANLVPGGVADGGHARPGDTPAAPPLITRGTPGVQSATPPQNPSGLSRNPDEVRGRLTNFRRGIQQGRTAGAGGMAPQPRDENNQEQA